MAIIVEGMDNSGKSTLAASFGLEVVHPGPRPRSNSETMRCLSDQLKSARLPIVMDRVTAVSSQVYGGEHNTLLCRPFLEEMVETQGCVVIYCRPPIEVIMDFSRHTVAGHDDKKQIEWMMQNAIRLVSRYDKLMATIPHLKYDYTNPNEEVADAASQALFTVGGWRQWQKMTKI